MSLIRLRLRCRHRLVDCKGNSQLRSPFACLIDANSSHFDKTVYYTVLKNQNSSPKGEGYIVDIIKYNRLKARQL